MKQLKLIIPLLFFAFIAKAQYPTPYQSLGSLNTAVRDTGGLFVRQTFVPPRFADTTAANVGIYTKNYAGSIIIANDTVWIRNTAKTAWLKVGSSSGGASENFANTDLIFTGDRYHNAEGIYGAEIDSLTYFSVRTLQDSLATWFFNSNNGIGLVVGDTAGNFATQVLLTRDYFSVYTNITGIPAKIYVPNSDSLDVASPTRIAVWDNDTLKSAVYTAPAASLTATYVGFGGVDNLLTGSANYRVDNSGGAGLGKFGINTPSLPTVPLDVVGSAKFKSSSFYVVGSNIYTDGLLQIDDASGTVNLGDFAASGNSTSLGIDDINKTVTLNAFGAYLQVGSASNETTISGALRLSTYGQGNITGTPTYLAAWDELGNVIETPYISGFDTSATWSVLNILGTAPVSPTTGDKYLVSSPGTGFSPATVNQIAEWDGAAWVGSTASAGDLLYNQNNYINYKFINGTTWTAISKAPHVQGGDRFGATAIIGTADNQAVGIRTNGVNRINISKTGGVTVLSLTGAAAGLAGTSTTGLLSNVQIGSNLSLVGGVLSATGGGGTYTGSNGITLVGSDFRNDFYTGKSGGDTLYGGTDSANNLTIGSTRHATKGKIIFGVAGTSAFDETTGFLGIGTTSPAQLIDITKNQNAVTALRIENSNSGSAAVAQVRMFSNTETTGFAMYAASSTYSGGVPANTNGFFSGTNNLRFTAFSAGTTITFETGSTMVLDANAKLSLTSLTGNSTPNFSINDGGTGSTDNILLRLKTSYGGTAQKRIIWADGTGSSTGSIATLFDGTNTKMIFGSLYNGNTTGYNTTDLMYLTADGYLGVGSGVSSPTAFVHPKASTTAAASLRIPAGTAPTSPNEGDIFKVSNDLQFRTNSVTYTLAKTITATSTLDFPSTGAGAANDLTITLTGAASGDIVTVGVVAGSVPSEGTYFGWVSSANTVTVRFQNGTGGSADPASGTFRVSVIQY